MTRAMATNQSSRAVDEVVALVGHARPHLVDSWEALAVLEASGYTDARVYRELGLSDTRALAEQVFEQLSDRPLPWAVRNDSEPVEADAPRFGATIGLALVWSVAVLALSVALHVTNGILQFALLPSVVVCCGFVEAMRRRGAFYAAIGQPQLGRMTCWYFMRLAAFVIAAVAAAGAGIGWLLGATWPQLVLWADAFVIASAAWLVGGASLLPGMFATRDRTASVPIPRMTVVAFKELRVLVASAAWALAFGVVVAAALTFGLPRVSGVYAAVGIVGGAALTFVLSTIAGRRSARVRPVSFS